MKDSWKTVEAAVCVLYNSSLTTPNLRHTHSSRIARDIPTPSQQLFRSHVGHTRDHIALLHRICPSCVRHVGHMLPSPSRCDFSIPSTLANVIKLPGSHYHHLPKPHGAAHLCITTTSSFVSLAPLERWSIFKCHCHLSSYTISSRSLDYNCGKDPI